MNKEVEGMKQVYTVETRLRINEENKTYLSAYITDYNRMYRMLWHEMTSTAFTFTYPTMAKFVTAMCQRFHVLKRTINAIRMDIQGRIKALDGLKKLELKNIEMKRKQIQLKIQQTTQKINHLKEKVRNNQATDKELTTYRTLKQGLFQRQQRLNRLTQTYMHLQQQIQQKKVPICFGGKRFFNKQYHLQANGYKTHTKWANDFRKQRDANISFLGSKDETAGNQLCQLRYHEETNDFSLQIRKEKAYETKESKYILFDYVDFKYQKEKIIELLGLLQTKDQQAQPLTYRVKRRKNKWYLQVMMPVVYEKEEYVTRKSQGVLGLDYNVGFIEVSETDRHGNLIYQERISLQYHGTGNKAKSEIEEKMSRLIQQAKSKGKDIIAEDLNFKTTKAKQLKASSAQRKAYNKMLHAFDYSRYLSTLQNIAFRQKVCVTFIPPMYTSRIAKEKYTKTKNQGASYVIARIGQGLQP